MYKFTSTITLLAITLCLYAQSNKVKSGPMLGYAEMKEAVVWIQLESGATVHAMYDDLSTPEKEEFKTAAVSTSANTGNTAKLYFTELEPGRQYDYQIYVDGEKQKFSYPTRFKSAPLWAYRTDPPAFTMALGSCFYINDTAYDRPGEPYGGDYQIIESIHQQKPDAMLWLGDNTYLRGADWWTRTGYIERYTHTRSLPQLQPLLASCNHFAIWDDHEFGPNDATGSWIHKDLAEEMFRLFWANHTFGYRDLKGIMSAFNYRDMDFILMDNRYHRSAQMAEGRPEQIFGRQQADRMIDLLKQSRAPFKFVATGGQFLNSAQVYENHANYEEERQYILDRINEENIKGVIFLSGDRHHSEVMQYTLPNGNVIHEFTVSPLTSGANKNVTETNQYQVEGSLIQERNFATLRFSGAFRERSLVITYYNSKGEELYRFQLAAQDLYKR